MYMDRHERLVLVALMVLAVVMAFAVIMILVEPLMEGGW